MSPRSPSWFGAESVHQRLYGVVSVGRFDRTDLLVAHAAVLIDNEGLRHAGDAEIDSCTPAAVKSYTRIGIAVVLQIFCTRRRPIFPVNSRNGNAAAVKIEKQRVLDAARHAP